MGEEGTLMSAARQVEDRGEAADTPPPWRSQNARQSISGRDFAPSAAVLGSQVGFRAVGAPWWTCCLLTALGLTAVCLRIVFPQDSPDKVAWWSERWRSRRHCQCQARPPVSASGPPERGA
jgi:hypothetical protein